MKLPIRTIFLADTQFFPPALSPPFLTVYDDPARFPTWDLLSGPSVRYLHGLWQDPLPGGVALSLPELSVRRPITTLMGTLAIAIFETQGPI